MGWMIPPFYSKTPLIIAYKELGKAIKKNDVATAVVCMEEIGRMLNEDKK